MLLPFSLESQWSALRNLLLSGQLVPDIYSSHIYHNKSEIVTQNNNISLDFFFFHNKLKILIFAHKINISDGSCWETFLFQKSPICSFPVARPGWALPQLAEQMCSRDCEIGHCWWKHHWGLPGTAQSRFQGLAPAEPMQSQCQNSIQGMSGAAPLQGEMLGAVISLSCLQECSISSKAFGGFPLSKVLENGLINTFQINISHGYPSSGKTDRNSPALCLSHQPLCRASCQLLSSCDCYCSGICCADCIRQNAPSISNYYSPLITYQECQLV